MKSITNVKQSSRAEEADLAAASNERINGIAAYLESGKGSRNLCDRGPTLGFVFEDHAFEQGFDDFLFFVSKLRDGFEL